MAVSFTDGVKPHLAVTPFDYSDVPRLLLAWVTFFTLDDPGWLLAGTAISIMAMTCGASCAFYDLP